MLVISNPDIIIDGYGFIGVDGNYAAAYDRDMNAYMSYAIMDSGLVGVGGVVKLDAHAGAYYYRECQLESGGRYKITGRRIPADGVVYVTPTNKMNPQKFYPYAYDYCIASVQTNEDGSFEFVDINGVYTSSDGESYEYDSVCVWTPAPLSSALLLGSFECEITSTVIKKVISTTIEIGDETPYSNNILTVQGSCPVDINALYVSVGSIDGTLIPVDNCVITDGNFSISVGSSATPVVKNTVCYIWGYTASEYGTIVVSDVTYEGAGTSGGDEENQYHRMGASFRIDSVFENTSVVVRGTCPLGMNNLTVSPGTFESSDFTTYIDTNSCTITEGESISEFELSVGSPSSPLPNGNDYCIWGFGTAGEIVITDISYEDMGRVIGTNFTVSSPYENNIVTVSVSCPLDLVNPRISRCEFTGSAPSHHDTITCNGYGDGTWQLSAGTYTDPILNGTTCCIWGYTKEENGQIIILSNNPDSGDSDDGTGSDDNQYVDSGSCLSGDTLITMADGSQRRMDEVCVGDMVLSQHGDATMVEIAERGLFNNRHILYTFDNGTIIDETHAHRFYNVEQGFWQNLEKWEIGEHARTSDGSQTALLSKKVLNERAEMFGIWTTEGSYYANGLLSGYAKCNQSLVENASAEKAIDMMTSLAEYQLLELLGLESILP